MKRLMQAVLACAVVLAVVSVVAAQQVPQPVVRLGNWLEVGNEVFMHIIATSEVHYKTTHNYDFENAIRDRVPSRSPQATTPQVGEGDVTWAQNRLGVEARYQKNLMFYLLFEHRQIFDGNTIDDRSNASNPGGTDIFGRAASTENPSFHTERYWIDYKFPGTPLRMRVGADLWTQDQAGLIGDDDPRFALFGEFGDFDLMAAAVIQNEAQRLGLQNDNDFVYYTFSAGYNLKPHRLQLDVTYFRDRWSGADLAGTTTTRTGDPMTPFTYEGQQYDSVLIMGSWSGRVGPVRGLLQGNVLTGTARGGTGRIPGSLPPGTIPGRSYDILAFAAVAYAEVDLGVVRPFVGLVFGTADGDPTDDRLRGFATLPQGEITLITGTPFFSHLDTSPAFAGRRDYGCPGRFNGLPSRFGGVAGNRSAVGTFVTAASAAGGFGECNHTVGNPFNDRLGRPSHPGINTTYSNPGTLVIPAGLKVFPVKGHEITGWYVYRGMIDTRLLELAFAPELAGRSIRKDIYHELGGYWQWTLNPHFDFRLAGGIGIPAGAFRDLARLANCNTVGPGGVGTPFRACEGEDVALRGEARFRARF